jgi:hypothetical protein
LLLLILLILPCGQRALAQVEAHGSARAPSGDARASDRLTSRGRFMPGGEVSAFWSNDQPTLFGNYATYSTWDLSVAPSLVYFVRDDIGIGIAGGGGYRRGKLSPRERYSTSEWSIGATFVWNVSLGARFSLMLRPFLGYAWAEQKDHVIFPSEFAGPNVLVPGALDDDPLFVGVTSRLSYVRFALSLPVVYAITDSVGIGIGPNFLYDLCFRDGHTTGLPANVGALTLPSDNRMRIGVAAALYASF